MGKPRREVPCLVEQPDPEIDHRLNDEGGRAARDDRKSDLGRIQNGVVPPVNLTQRLRNCRFWAKPFERTADTAGLVTRFFEVCPQLPPQVLSIRAGHHLRHRDKTLDQTPDIVRLFWRLALHTFASKVSHDRRPINGVSVPSRCEWSAQPPVDLWNGFLIPCQTRGQKTR